MIDSVIQDKFMGRDRHRITIREPSASRPIPSLVVSHFRTSRRFESWFMSDEFEQEQRPLLPSLYVD